MQMIETNGERPGGQIAVVFDGSSRSWDEVRWAADLALARNATVDLIAIPLRTGWSLFAGSALVMTIPINPVGAIEADLAAVTKEIPAAVAVRTRLLPAANRGNVFDHLDRDRYDVVLNGPGSFRLRARRRLRLAVGGRFTRAGRQR